MTRIIVDRESYLPNQMDATFEITADVSMDRTPSHPDDPCGGNWEITVENVTAKLVEWLDDEGHDHDGYEAVLKWGPGMIAEIEAQIAKAFTADDLTEYELERVSYN